MLHAPRHLQFNSGKAIFRLDGSDGRTVRPELNTEYYVIRRVGLSSKINAVSLDV